MRKEVEVGRRGKRRRHCASSSFSLSFSLALLSSLFCAFVYFFVFYLYLLRAPFFFSLFFVRLVLSRSSTTNNKASKQWLFSQPPIETDG
jgi:hypothetical protein